MVMKFHSKMFRIGKMREVLISILLFGISIDGFSRVEERGWRKVPIRNAYCGNGEPYHIFMSAGDPTKLALGFMGGGACWDKRTCYGPAPLTVLMPLPFMPHNTGIFSKKRGPVKDYTHVFLPYCTGDVFIGKHEATYRGRKTLHRGQFNVEMAMKQIFQITPELKHVETLFVHGSSGGAIGALFHLNLLNRSFPDARKKILIADSPGLHFGKKFWNKFSAPLKKDFADAFSEIMIPFTPENGDVAEHMDDLCQNFNDWRIGFMQFDKDIIMSQLFGEVFPYRHHRRVYGKSGIWQTLLGAKVKNCSVWVGRGYGHTVLLTTTSMLIKRDGVRAEEFVRSLVETDQKVAIVPDAFGKP